MRCLKQSNNIVRFITTSRSYDKFVSEYELELPHPNAKPITIEVKNGYNHGGECDPIKSYTTITVHWVIDTNS